MKKFTLITLLLAVLLMPSAVFGQTIKWHLCRGATIAWDVVTTYWNDPDGDGPLPAVETPLPAGDTVKYMASLKDRVTSVVTPLSADAFSETEFEFVLTPGMNGQYLFGVKALRYGSDGVFISESTMSWTDVAQACADITGDGVGDPFGFVYGTMPSNVRVP